MSNLSNILGHLYKRKWVVYLLLLSIAFSIDKLGKFYYILIPVVFYIFVFFVLWYDLKLNKNGGNIPILILVSVLFILLEGVLSYHYYANKIDNFVSRISLMYLNSTVSSSLDNVTITLSDLQKLIYKLDEYNSHYYLFIFVVVIALILVYTSLKEVENREISLSPKERILYSLIVSLFSVIIAAYFYEAHTLSYYIILILIIMTLFMIKNRKYNDLVLILSIILGVSLGFYIITVLF